MLRRLRQGDGAALEALMDRYLPYVSAVVWNITGHALPREDGEEVAADVFVAAWDHAADLRPGKVKAWLGAVARNKARNRLRTAGLDLPLEEALEVAAPGGPAEEVERDGISKPLTIHGLWVQSPDKEYTPVFTGEFTFDIGLYFESQVVEVDTLGTTWTNELYGFTNRLEELTLSPLSLSCRWSTNLEENGIIGAALGDLRIVLKDGTVFWPKETIVRNPGKRDSRFDESSVKDTFVHTYDTCEVFDAPLDLSQVDCIQYGGTKLTLPQS